MIQRDLSTKVRVSAWPLTKKGIAKSRSSRIGDRAAADGHSGARVLVPDAHSPHISEVSP